MPQKSDVLDALTAVIDPEIGINIVDLGLVERLDAAEKNVYVGLIMTTPACPQGDLILDRAREAIFQRLGGGLEVVVDILDGPAWSPERMSDKARSQMGWEKK